MAVVAGLRRGTTAGLWIHLTLVFVVAAQALIYLILAAFRSREAPLGWQPFAAWILTGTLTVQLYALSLPEFLRSALGETSMNSDWTNPIWSILETLRVLQIGFSGFAVVLCGGAMVAAGWLSIVRRSVRAGLVMVLPGIMGAAYMLFSAHNFWPRFFLPDGLCPADRNSRRNGCGGVRRAGTAAPAAVRYSRCASRRSLPRL